MLIAHGSLLKSQIINHKSHIINPIAITPWFPYSMMPIDSMGLLEGKLGLVFGVANKRSIAWAIAQAWARFARGEYDDPATRSHASQLRSPQADNSQPTSHCAGRRI